MTGPSESEESAVEDARREQMARWRANWTGLQAAEGASSADTAEELQAVIDELQWLIDKLHLRDTIDFLKSPHYGYGRIGWGLWIILVALMTVLTVVAFILGLWRRLWRSWRARQSGGLAGHRGDHDTPG